MEDPFRKEEELEPQLALVMPSRQVAVRSPRPGPSLDVTIAVENEIIQAIVAIAVAIGKASTSRREQVSGFSRFDK
eukprot:scaffold70400_cov54-Attheya_sp.AAC.1